MPPSAAKVFKLPVGTEFLSTMRLYALEFLPSLSRRTPAQPELMQESVILCFSCNSQHLKEHIQRPPQHKKLQTGAVLRRFLE